MSSLNKRRSVVQERKKEKASISAQIGDLFKSFDIYGEKISLTYKGEDSFKTFPGAFASILVISIVLVFGVYRSFIMVNRINPDVSKKSFLRDLNVAENYSPQDLGFDFAFSPNAPLDPTIFTLTAKFVNYYYVADPLNPGEYVRKRDKIPLDYALCDGIEA